MLVIEFGCVTVTCVGPNVEEQPFRTVGLMIKLRDLITEVAWFRNLRKDGSTWMMTSGPEHKPKETKIPNLNIICSTLDLAASEIELAEMDNRENIMKNILNKIVGYDYLFIDCPPALGLLTINSLVASDSVIVPLQCEFFALEGLSALTSTIETIKSNLNPQIQIEGVVLTMYDKRNSLSALVEEDVRGHFGKKVYKTVIPRNVRISEAPSHGKPVLIYDTSCVGSMAYIGLAKEEILNQ